MWVEKEKEKSRVVGGRREVFLLQIKLEKEKKTECESQRHIEGEQNARARDKEERCEPTHSVGLMNKHNVS